MERPIEPDGYRLVRLLARSTGSLLYRGERARDGTAVLIKLLRPEGHESRYREQLEHEYQVVRALRSPVALEALEIAGTAANPALILEPSQAVPLRDLLRPAGMEVGEFLHLATAICSALARLHEQRCVHLDLGPDHILVGPGHGEVKFTGFGIASFLQGGRVAASAPLEPGGTLSYLSPEQTGRSNEPLDVRSDLYSLGVVFYQMLAGELPLRGRDALESLHMLLAVAPRPLSALRGDLPSPVSDIVGKLLAKAPDARYQSAVGLELDLRQCAHEWRAGRSVAPFPLATRDVPVRLVIRDRLYGREDQLAQLLDSFDRVARDRKAELTLVHGEPGIGKSALVAELQARLQERVLAASGKFDQYKRGIPYFTLAQAFRQVVQQMLAGRAEALAAWKARLGAALGAHAKLISDIIPELRLVLGDSPEVPALGPVEARNRFALVFQDFIEAVGTPARPLLLFLDDMQWADGATLELMERLLSSGQLRHVHLLFAYRDNEVDATHPLALLFDKLNASAVRMSTIELAALNEAQVAELVADTLGTDAAPLAALLHRKTEGNPFFVRELLKSLYQEGRLRFDPAARRWHWDAREIDSAAVTDDVVELMVLRLHRLSPAAQPLVRVAAAIGSSFDLETLAAAAEAPPEEVAALLREAADEGLVAAATGAAWQFRHDRIQQAAYSTIEPPQRARLHLRIGRVMLARTGAQALEDRLFDVVNQLDLGIELISDTGERQQLAELNLRAGRKAMAASAYGPALRYLSQATELMSAEAWQTDYDQIFQAFLDCAECEYLAGEFDRAESLLQHTLERAVSDLDRARVYGVWLLLHQISGRFSEGVELGARALELFDVALPADPAALSARIRAVRESIEQELARRDIGALTAAPRMTDPRAQALARVLAGLGPLTYLGRPEAFPLIPLELVSLSLRHGHAEESCFGYSMYAMLLVSVFDDVEAGYRFSSMAMELSDRLDAARLRGVVLHIHGNHVSCWKQPFASSLRYVERAFAASIAAGDFIYSNYCAFMSGWLQLERGAPLAELQRSTERYLSFASRSRNMAVFETIRIEQQLVAALQGHTVQPGSLSDATFDEHEALARIKRGGLLIGVGFYHAAKLVLHVVFGQAQAALRAAAEARACLGAATALPVEVSLDFFEGLAASRAHAEAPDEERPRLLRTVADCRERLERRARDCLQNFGAKSLLLGAEHAVLQGDTTRALQLYDQAVRAARDAGALHDEAIALEQLGLLCEREQMAGFAGFSLGEARRAYLQWGATAKVAQLDERHPLQPLQRRPAVAEEPIHAEELDLMAAIKASQAISGEIVLPKLSQTLMRLVLEHAGAERAALALLDGDEVSIAAQASAASTAQEPFPEDVRLPQSIVNVVCRSGETVLLEDARKPNPYSTDPYLRECGPRSLLCLPVKRQGRLLGMLYMEHGQISGAFTPARLALLRLLAAQTAISLENVQLYREAGQLASVQRHADRLKRLAEVSLTLNASASVESMLDVLTQQARELIGAHQAVSSVSTGGIRAQSISAVSLSDKYADKRSGDKPADASGVCALFGESNELMQMTRAELEAHPVWRSLGRETERSAPMRGLLAVPMVAQDGGHLGLIQLSDKVEGEFTEEDQTLLQQLAQVASVVLERAWAQNRLEEADRRKDEFIATLSHELRNPLAPLRSAVEVLQSSQAADGTTRPLLDMMRRQILHMVHLIDDLLDVSRITIGKIELRRERLTLRSVLDSAIEASRPLIDSGRHELVLRLPPEPLHLDADAVRLTQVVSNLLNNSAKYTPQGGTIELAAAREGPDAVIRVRDNGVGIVPEMLPRVFDMFTQVDKTLDRSQQGLGIGLSIVKRLVEMHQGTVEADSLGLGHGAVFTVRLPLVQDEPQQHHPSDGDKGTVRAARQRVLVVDDNADAAETLAMMLELLGHESRSANSGAEGLRLAREFLPSVVICDIGMQGMNGHEVARRFRADPALAQTLLVALTGWGTESDKREAMEAGFDFHLTKPVDIADINNLLARRSEQIDAGRGA